MVVLSIVLNLTTLVILKLTEGILTITQSHLKILNTDLLRTDLTDLKLFYLRQLILFLNIFYVLDSICIKIILDIFQSWCKGSIILYLYAL